MAEFTGHAIPSPNELAIHPNSGAYPFGDGYDSEITA